MVFTHASLFVLGLFLVFSDCRVRRNERRLNGPPHSSQQRLNKQGAAAAAATRAEKAEETHWGVQRAGGNRVCGSSVATRRGRGQAGSLVAPRAASPSCPPFRFATASPARLLRDAGRRACPLPPTRALKLDRERGGICAVGWHRATLLFVGGWRIAGRRSAGHRVPSPCRWH